jgi:hypothetical protein
MHGGSTDPDERILGVERELLVRFLVLIRDNHKKANAAHVFLEQRTGTSNVYGIANLRDVLSHLATFLGDGLSLEKRREQLANGEEHLRRAIVEPYETALNSRTVHFEDLYAKYRRQVIPIKDRHAVLRMAPNVVSVEATLDEIRALTANGKDAKLRNLMDPEWEAGVVNIVDGYKKLDDLTREVEGYYDKWEQLRMDRHSRRLAVLSIVLTLLVGALGIWVSYLLSSSAPQS